MSFTFLHSRYACDDVGGAILTPFAAASAGAIAMLDRQSEERGIDEMEYKKGSRIVQGQPPLMDSLDFKKNVLFLYYKLIV